LAAAKISLAAANIYLGRLGGCQDLSWQLPRSILAAAKISLAAAKISLAAANIYLGRLGGCQDISWQQINALRGSIKSV